MLFCSIDSWECGGKKAAAPIGDKKVAVPIGGKKVAVPIGGKKAAVPIGGKNRVECRGLRPRTLPHHRTYRFQYPAVGVTRGSFEPRTGPFFPVSAAAET